MERNILNLPITDLNYDLKFSDNSNLFTMAKLKSFIKKFGQWRHITVCNMHNKWWMVEGDEILEAMVDEGFVTIACVSLGFLTRDDYLAARLFLTARTERLNYTDIAKAVTEHSQPNELPNVTTLNRDDIEKYKQLLTFDWDAFLKAPVNPGQIKLFEDER